MASKYARLMKVNVLGLINDEDTKLIKSIAQLMKEMDYSTSQREDAYEILNKRKMDGEQVLYRLSNMQEFVRILSDDIKRIKKEVKETLNEFIDDAKGDEHED